jgi:hypothetical protein
MGAHGILARRGEARRREANKVEAQKGGGKWAGARRDLVVQADGRGALVLAWYAVPGPVFVFACRTALACLERVFGGFFLSRRRHGMHRQGIEGVHVLAPQQLLGGLLLGLASSFPALLDEARGFVFLYTT